MSGPGPRTDADALLALRLEVRRFLAAALDEGVFEPGCDGWLSGFSPEFSAAVGERGWIGLTWPVRYGGQERSHLERFTVIEELLAAGAPVAAHWFADRQIGPSLLRHGTEEQRERYLPSMARGTRYFAVGLSEPEAGSDLAALTTTARRANGGWVVTGTKVWTSNAHRVHHVLVLARTPHDGAAAGRVPMTQFIVDVPSPDVTIRPIRTIGGEEHFCEVFLDDVFVPDRCVLGVVGEGWTQAMSELADERSGPERYLSTMPMFRAWLSEFGTDDTDELGHLVANLVALREASLAVAGALERGEDVSLAGALVKDVGTRFEQELVDFVGARSPRLGRSAVLDGLLVGAVRHAPGFTLRGGTTEILRSIVGRGLA